MAKTRIAAALVMVMLAGCSVEEPDQSLPVARPPLADQDEGETQTDDGKGSDAFEQTPATTAKPIAVENAGLRAGFNAQCLA